MKSNFRGILETDYCTVCKSKNQIDYDDNYAFDSTTCHYFMFGKCHICKKIFMYEYNEKTSSKFSIAKVAGGYTDVEFVYRYPANEPTVYDNVPNDIKKSYIEGVNCLNINAPNAAVTMFRRTLQQVCKDKKTTKKELKDQIDEMIPQELKDTARELRLWGNLGAHPDDFIGSVSIDDAKEFQEFIDKVLYSLYEYPAKIQGKQTKRLQGK